MPRDRGESRRPRRVVKLVANPALTGFTAPKLLWVRNHEPANWDRVARSFCPRITSVTG